MNKKNKKNWPRGKSTNGKKRKRNKHVHGQDNPQVKQALTKLEQSLGTSVVRGKSSRYGIPYFHEAKVIVAYWLKEDPSLSPRNVVDMLIDNYGYTRQQGWVVFQSVNHNAVLFDDMEDIYREILFSFKTVITEADGMLAEEDLPEYLHARYLSEKNRATQNLAKFVFGENVNISAGGDNVDYSQHFKEIFGGLKVIDVSNEQEDEDE